MEVPIPVPVPTPAPVHIPSPVSNEVDLNEGDMELLRKQIEKMEQKQVEKEIEVPQETEGLSEEDVQKLQQLQAEIERLQNSGIFRAEMLYQCVGLNTNLERIANALERFGGRNANQ